MNALMIMCHRDMEQVIRLAQRCRTENTDVIIHCDLKVDSLEYKKLADCVEKLGSGYYLTDNRLHGELDTRSLVDIAMEMIGKAAWVEKSEHKKYRYFLLNSGQDYPIKPMSYIEKELSALYPKPFIDCTPCSRGNWVWQKFQHNKAVLSLGSRISRSFRKGPVRSGLRVLQLGLKKVAGMFRLTSFARAEKLGVTLYGGSAWWILPDRIIDFIRREYETKDSKVMDLLLNRTYTPEESFFQIMAMRSPLKDMVEINPADMVEQNCKTWAYFSDEGKPFTGHPYAFTVKEFEKIAKSDCWFGRKFDRSVDSDILTMIDNEILLP